MSAIEVNPALLLIVAGLVVGFSNRAARQVLTLASPVIGLALLFATPIGANSTMTLAGLPLTILRLDALAYPFALIFLIATLLNSIYALHQDDRLHDAASLIYAGAGLGGVLAGDLATLFIFWELTALSSVFLIVGRGTARAYRAAIRYLVWQIGSGVLLLAGLLILWRTTGSLAFSSLKLAGLGPWLIFIAFGIKCAFPLLHTWLQDAYPEATVTGTVVLSAFTTKLAVYAFARVFPGESLLIPIGAIMTCFPIFFAIIENDLRRVLAFALISQLGFMVVGIGIGSELAMTGAVSHAVGGILYTSLLFMSLGAVLHRVGTAKASELGGLSKSMPITSLLCIIGAVSIAGLPLTTGFVTKNMTITATEQAGLLGIWLMLLFASAGIMGVAGIKVPYFAFFHSDAGHRVREAPVNMLVAMGLAAAGAIAIGIAPRLLYGIMPYPVTKEPYTLASIITKSQLLVFAALGFWVAIRLGWYPKVLPSTNLNSDWLYRRVGKAFVLGFAALAASLGAKATRGVLWISDTARAIAHRHHSPQGVLGRTWPTGTMAFWTTVMLGAYLVLVYLR